VGKKFTFDFTCRLSHANRHDYSDNGSENVCHFSIASTSYYSTTSSLFKTKLPQRQLLWQWRFSRVLRQYYLRTPHRTKYTVPRRATHSSDCISLILQIPLRTSLGGRLGLIDSAAETSIEILSTRHRIMATTLLSLPPELLANVFFHLDDSSFFSGRLANRNLEQASFTLFGRRFFRKKGYMITNSSLDVLRSVASHDKLRVYVQHVWFNPDCYTYDPLPISFEPLHRRIDWDIVPQPQIHPNSNESDINSNKPDVTTSENIRGRSMMENMALLSTKALFGDDRPLFNILKSTFATLPNLRTVGMRRSEQHSPWGWSRLNDAVGKDPRELGHLSNVSNVIPGPTILYMASMHTLAASGSRIQRLYTDAIQIDDISIRLPPVVMQEACNSLLYLEINLTKGNSTTYAFFEDRVRGRRADAKLPEQPHGTGLARLLSACPNLRELGLMVFPDRHESHFVAPQGGWHKSYTFSVLKHLTDNVQLCNLRRIKLEEFTTLPSALISLLLPSAPHLTSIKLRDIRLVNDRDDDDNRPWEAIFAFLAASCPKLSYLLLYHLYHTSGGVRFVQHLPSHPPPQAEEDSNTVSSTENFTDYENIAVEVGTPHSDPDTEGSERRAAIFRAREIVGDRVRALVNGHWYGQNLFSYEMDETLWHTDTSDEEW
jgi:hypothetical protein